MQTALYLNGVYEDVLDELLAAQRRHSGPHFLQPYSSHAIARLKKNKPTRSSPTTLYISTTKALDCVTYVGKIVEWLDKRTLEPAELDRLNAQLREFQPGEKEIYLHYDGKPCVNLMLVSELAKLNERVPVSCFMKVGNMQPLQRRSRAGGWAYVLELPDWVGASPTRVAEDVDRELDAEVSRALQDTSSARRARLLAASPKPETIKVISRAFCRNPDVIAEVLSRAAGKCETCGRDAPFVRKSSGTPYLEVPHEIPLGQGGDDTVENAVALCPNCHREEHFG